jgi:Flp pilus assembly protein TadD
MFAVSRARGQLRAGETASAIAGLRQAVQQAPEYAEGHFELANALARSGDAAGARLHYQQAQRLAPYLRPPDAAN